MKKKTAKKKITFNDFIPNVNKLPNIFVECDSDTGEPQHWIGNEYNTIIEILKKVSLLTIAPRITKATHKHYANHSSFENATKEEKEDVIACIEEIIDVLEKYSKKHLHPNIKKITYDEALLQEEKNTNKRKEKMLEAGVTYIQDGKFHVKE